MAKKKKEKVTEEVIKEKKVETPKIDLEKFDSKDDSSVTKVDLSKPPPIVKKKEEKKEEVKEEVKQDVPIEEVKEEVEEEVKEVETPILEEVTSEKTEEEIVEQTEKIAEEASEAIAESQETGEPLPENVQKLVDFMNETGGDIQDYVMLNQDYSQLNEESLLREYYKNTKPHLDNEEIDFLMEDQFHYDEDEDDEKDIKRKRLALKEQVAGARAHLDGQKSKYYEDIKAGSKLTPEQKDAIDFFNRYTEESEKNEKIVKAQSDTFINKTNNVFNDKFKGFEYNVGEKKYRFNVKNVGDVKETQSDVNNFFNKFLDKNNTMEDAAGYHKSLFTAMNADAIANHFYEQGKADAMKDSIAKAKNVDMSPRQSHGEVEAGGMKFRILGDDADGFRDRLRVKTRK
jgi:hypothetical protein